MKRSPTKWSVYCYLLTSLWL